MAKSRTPVAVISQIADIIFLSISLMQQITGKSMAEVLEIIKEEEAKTDELLEKLR